MRIPKGINRISMIINRFSILRFRKKFLMNTHRKRKNKKQSPMSHTINTKGIVKKITLNINCFRGEYSRINVTAEALLEERRKSAKPAKNILQTFLSMLARLLTSF